MFKKPLTNLKSFSPLRSSDRRRFQNEVYDAYPSIKEECTKEGATPLMPDTLQSAKFVTHIKVGGTMYVVDKNPLWLKVDNLKPVPTVYTMWRWPDILPKLYTWGPVIHKLMEGADLMIPGLVYGPEGTLPNLDTGDLVAITIKDYPFPLAVGTMALPSKDIKVRSGMKGKAVHIIHVFHDYLWSMGDKSEPPELQVGSESDTDEEEEDGQENPSSAQDDMESAPVPAPVAAVQENEDAQEESTESSTVQLTTNEIDDLLKVALYQALCFKVTSEQAATLLPISASTLYASYILPSRPFDVGSEVDVKKSSWKKVQKFLKVMEKNGLLKLKEQRGETMVTSINFSHPSLQNVEPIRTIGDGSKGTQSSSNGKLSEAATSSTTAPQKMESATIEELYKPLGNSILVFFDAAKHDKNAMYTAAEVRKVLTDYVKGNNLADPRNQKMVKIDAILCDALLTKPEYNTVEKLARDQLGQRLLSKMQHFHVLTLPGKEPVLRKGEPKPVNITQEIRQGRKTITKVTGVEAFELDIDDLCKDLTKLCASSATYNPIHGVSPKNPLYEIMVQGPQIKNVSELLLRKGVPKKLIEVNDKTSKKGKGKK
ncbi:uncharacterized protein BYT42DRAFT_554517 [Radiomyces spectabilis]|uniref:uncharacterized protein n=1 Tax=Radiomyces spectabilis TaxID=64574 RepID=UPI00221E996F|nr:uncharacterized protein BYT42DRAFT_554517 [Radiomyces spectabilis]KAI8390842.1 hypothetical protein BYT42DRAFT_554517 [Radiomyces spectabilis]